MVINMGELELSEFSLRNYENVTSIWHIPKPPSYRQIVTLP